MLFFDVRGEPAGQGEVCNKKQKADAKTEK